MLSIQINSSSLTNFINKLQKSVDNFSLAGTENEVKLILSNAFAQNILTRGGRLGSALAPLRDGSGRTPLLDEGNLFASAKNPDVSIDNNKYVVSFNGPGAKTLALHNKGFTVTRKLKKGGTKKYKVVQRRVIALNADDIDQIRKIVVRQYKKTLLGLG